MSYSQFKSDYWADEILLENDRQSVFAKNTYRKYEGNVKNQGDVVKISALAPPTIYETTSELTTIEDPETLADTTAKMPINFIDYFNFRVDDIDKAQTKLNIMSDAMHESSVALASKADQNIAALAKDNLAVKLNSSAVTVTTDNVFGMLDKAIQTLWENDVPTNTEVYVTVSPRFFTILKQKWISLDTDNSDIIARGYLAKYSNALIDMSNNVAKSDDGTTDFIMVRTQKAIAYANPLVKTEPYRMEKAFSDAVKGFMLYGTKIIRPKELVVVNCKYA